MQSVTLIIDKRRELSTKYKKLLASAGNIVIVTKDLISAMKTIQDKEPDIILISDSIDNDLSDYCKKIRALTYNTRPIIIGMSKSAELQDRLKVLQNGADDFISEPVNPDEFVMRIFAHLRREFESNLDYKKLLPNKNYSMRAIKRIIHSNSDWACMLLSIENYTSYKENYTELAADCNAADTVIKLKDASKWKSGPLCVAAFDTDPSGRLSDLPNFNVSKTGAKSLVNKNGVWELTLKHPCGKNFPAGTTVREHRAGWSVIYAGTPRQLLTPEWAKIEVIIEPGEVPSASIRNWWKGTAKAGLVVESAGNGLMFRNLKLEAVPGK